VLAPRPHHDIREAEKTTQTCWCMRYRNISARARCDGKVASVIDEDSLELSSQLIRLGPSELFDDRCKVIEVCVAWPPSLVAHIPNQALANHRSCVVGRCETVPNVALAELEHVGPIDATQLHPERHVGSLTDAQRVMH